MTLEELIPRIGDIPPERLPEILKLVRKLDEAQKREAAQGEFLPFVKSMWPSFIAGRHHGIMADAFQRVLDGKCKRLIINLGPRHTKSEFASFLLPAWFLGRNPDKKIIQCSNTAELAVGFGRKVRNLVGSEDYQKVFKGVGLRADSKAAGRWSTNRNGEYFAIGVGGTVTGKGADLLIVDDPHALEVSTPIPTPGGFVPIGELRVGDFVFGPDGKSTRVVAKSDVWHERDLFRVETDDGQHVLCDGGHLWTYRSDTKLSAPHRTATTRDLLNWSASSKPCLPRHAAVEYPEQDFPVDPWVLGAWLGDGTTGYGRMTAHPDDMPYMRAQFEAVGYETAALTDPYSFAVRKLRAKLRDIGVLFRKHIPPQYLRGSVQQRMALLQGLMDTDGNVTEAGQCAFHSADPVLVDTVVELLHSLGLKARRQSYPDDRRGYQTRHRVTFKLKDAARMPRKACRTYTPTDKRCRSFVVTPTGARGSVQCITVDRPDGLFLAGPGYIVTHNSEQEAALAAGNPAVFDGVYEWYTSGPRQRLQPGGTIVVVMTRWSKRDLTGRILQASFEREGVDQWEVIELPAIMPSGDPLWPEFWSLKELEAIRAELPIGKWAAQYLQQPTSEEGAILKREWWRKWEKEDPPAVEYVIVAADTAFTKNERSDYSAFTIWGVFYREGEDGAKAPNLILLDAFKNRWEFPELKAKALEIYRNWQPDAFVVEGKASGLPLIHELRQTGIPVSEFTPTRATGDKVVRANAVSDIMASGLVWAPEKRWAEEVIEECASFPAGAHDDYVDSVIMALMRYRQGGFISLPTDEEDDWAARRAPVEYY